MTTLSIDIETYSDEDLPKTGVYRYAESPVFEITLLAYAYDDQEVHIVDLLSGQSIPDQVLADLVDPDVTKTAFNAAFERTCLSAYLGKPMPPEQWRCTSVLSLTLGLPGNLGAVGDALRLAKDRKKMGVGRSLISYFCKPCKPTKVNGQRTRNFPHHDPDRWALFKEYCKQDVVSEREIRNRLLAFDLTPTEQALWCLDQKINERGALLDMQLVEHAIRCDEIYTERLLAEAIEITKLDNPKSVTQLKKWLRDTDDIEVDSLNKQVVPELLRGTANDNVRRVLELRQEMAKSSVSKYKAMKRAVSADGRVRGLHQFYGANRTGRWAGRVVQTQNLPQNKLEDLDLARTLLRNGQYDELELMFGNVPDTLSQLIRTAIIPSPGRELMVVDFSAIEARVLAWLAWEEWRIEVFNTHGKIYEASAEQMFHLPKGSVGKGSPYRQKGKVAELACFGRDTRVLTNSGVKTIVEITTKDKLWDGKKWVSHDGIIFKGFQKTITLHGVQATPDHKVLVGRRWKEMRDLASNESILCQALETGSANLPSFEQNALRAGFVSRISSGFNVLVEHSLTKFIQAISGKVGPQGVMPALKNKPVTGESLFSSTPRPAQTTSTEGACLIDYLLVKTDATTRTTKVTKITEGGAFSYTRRGEEIKPHFYDTWSRFKVGTIRNLKSIASTLIRVTSPATYALLQDRKMAKTKDLLPFCSSESNIWNPVFDILNSGSRNRFTILTDAGPLIVHNCGYQGGAGALITMGALKSGLTEDELPPIIKQWRSANPSIENFWYAVERSATAAIREKQTVLLSIAGERAWLTFSYEKGCLFIKLPSGRRLCYYRARMEHDEKFNKTAITYGGLDQKTKQWSDNIRTYGGKLVENITQAIARDCLREGLFGLDDAGYETIMHIHDEAVTDGGSLEQAEAIMGTPIPWAPGLPLRGDGYLTPYYRKD